MHVTKVNSVLVTGASGFVGSALVRDLHKCGYKVTQLVRSNSSQCNPDIKTFYLNNIDEVGSLSVPLRDVDVVIHLAARVHVMDEDHSDTLAEYRRVNVEYTINLARQAASFGVKRFIFMSSIKVNGEFTQIGRPFSADDNPSPHDPYGVSKLEAEIGLLQLAKETGIEVVIIRSPIVYGPGVKANFLKMIKILQAGIPLPFGDVNNMRSLVFVSNLVSLIIKVLDHPHASGEVFFVSDDKDVSTTYLLNALANAITGKKARLISVPESLLKVILKITGKSAMADRLLNSLQLDIDKTKHKLDWVPPVSFDQAIQFTVNNQLHISRH